jgi:hypothetical protein
LLASPARAEQAAPASNGSLSLFQTLPKDPAPESITRNQHYWISNEQRLDLFHDPIKDLGGVYIGVGSDQNYLHAGWAKTEVLVLMDFDHKIVDLHKVYEVAFKNSATKEEFIALWSDASKPKLKALIEKAHPAGKLQKDVVQAHRAAQRVVTRRFKRLAKQMIKAKLPSFLTDDATYAYIRGLFQNGKVFMVRGDLTAKIAMKAISKATEQAGLKVRVLYLSNAEQYFNVRSSFRDNIVSLPIDSKSLVIRTNGWRGLAHVEGTGYHYNVQSTESFKQFVAHPLTKSSAGMLKQAVPSSTILGFSTLNRAPADTKEEGNKRSKERKKIEAPMATAAKRRFNARMERDENGDEKAQARAARRKANIEKRDAGAQERREERAERKRLLKEKKAERKRLRDEKRGANKSTKSAGTGA